MLKNFDVGIILDVEDSRGKLGARLLVGQQIHLMKGAFEDEVEIWQLHPQDIANRIVEAGFKSYGDVLPVAASSMNSLSAVERRVRLLRDNEFFLNSLNLPEAMRQDILPRLAGQDITADGVNLVIVGGRQRDHKQS